MDASPEQGELIRQRFDLFEEFSEAVQGWDLDFCQLSPSQAPFYLQQLVGSAVLVSRAYLSPGFYQQGGATPGFRTVSLIIPRESGCHWRWCGETVTVSSLLVMPTGGEFESVSSPDFDSIHLALSLPLLEQVAWSQFALPLEELMPRGRCFCPDGGRSLHTLRALLESLTLSPDYQSPAARLRLTPGLEQEMAYLVLSCLAGPGVISPRGPRGKRMRSLARAIEILSEEGSQRLSLSQLVSATGVSRRTLENAFRDGLGIGPAAFMKSHRLHQLQRALHSADTPVGGIAPLARAHGFHHLGQLAADYRGLFGELPSTTLKRGNGVA